MDAATSERILGYFIEEAKEHLETLEKGILELSTVVNDSERINELFRAAHSLKGGAAMLNLSSIQKTSHRLEDAFKILRDGDVQVDQRLESLFWDAYDILQDLIERLQSALGLQEDEADAILKEAEPTFTELQQYLQHQRTSDKITQPTPPEVPVSEPLATKPALFGGIQKQLREMLGLFKQKPTPQNRQQLQEICQRLIDLCPSNSKWRHLIQTCAAAIANPKHSYQLLAPVVIREIKQAADYLELGKAESIAPSFELDKLAQAQIGQFLVTAEPKAAAQALLQVFSQQQLQEIIQILQSKC